MMSASARTTDAAAHETAALGAAGPEARVARPSAVAQYRTLVAKDLACELRTGKMVASMGIYALLVIAVFGAALSETARSVDIARMSGGLIWALVAFTALLGLNRSFSHEREFGALEGILMAPLDRSVVFLAKATSNFLFVTAVEMIAVPVYCFFFLSSEPLSPTCGLIVVPLLLGTVGVAGVGTMLATVSAHARGSDVILAALFVPLAYPLLHACSIATTQALGGDAALVGGFGAALLVAAVYDLVMILACWVLYDFAISA